MKQVLWIVAGALLMFIGGYWSAAQWDSDKLWDEDTLLSTAGKTVPQQNHEVRPALGPDALIRFTDAAADLGIEFTYYNGAEGNYYLMETTGGGMAVLDFDGDGNQDIFFVNGCSLPVDPTDRRFVSALYRNRGNFSASEVAEKAGVDLAAYGQGAAAGDFDNDGFPDFCVTCYARCVLYHNNGDGTFSDVSLLSGVQSGAWTTSAAFADLDQDGALDLYVCAYGQVAVDRPRVCGSADRRSYCLPSVYPSQADLLFRNQGDGLFREVGEVSGIHDKTGRGLGLVIADFDGDRAADIFVANDTSENFLFLNRHDFQFRESALNAGVALTSNGTTMSGMGVACADFDRNGWPDILVTNFYQERSALYQNVGSGTFTDVADATGIGAASRDRLGFGTVFLDANHDRFPDLFVANGHINDMSHAGVPYRMRQQLLVNNGGKRFQDISDWTGPYFGRPLLGRGVAGLDYNNDGLPDVVVSHLFDPVALLINRTAEHGHWIGLELIGTSATRDGTNTKVTVQTGGQFQSSELPAGTGYLSSSDKRLLITIGESTQVDDVMIEWPSGKVQNLGPLPADGYGRVREQELDLTQ